MERLSAARSRTSLRQVPAGFPRGVQSVAADVSAINASGTRLCLAAEAAKGSKTAVAAATGQHGPVPGTQAAAAAAARPAAADGYQRPRWAIPATPGWPFSFEERLKPAARASAAGSVHLLGLPRAPALDADSAGEQPPLVLGVARDRSYSCSWAAWLAAWAFERVRFHRALTRGVARDRRSSCCGCSCRASTSFRCRRLR